MLTCYKLRFQINLFQFISITCISPRWCVSNFRGKNGPLSQHPSIWDFLCAGQYPLLGVYSTWTPMPEAEGVYGEYTPQLRILSSIAHGIAIANYEILVTHNKGPFGFFKYIKHVSNEAFMHSHYQLLLIIIAYSKQRTFNI